MVCVNDIVKLNSLNPRGDAQKYLSHLKLSSVMAPRSLAGVRKRFGGTDGVHLHCNTLYVSSIFLRNLVPNHHKTSRHNLKYRTFEKQDSLNTYMVSRKQITGRFQVYKKAYLLYF